MLCKLSVLSDISVTYTEIFYTYPKLVIIGIFFACNTLLFPTKLKKHNMKM